MRVSLPHTLALLALPLSALQPAPSAAQTAAGADAAPATYAQALEETLLAMDVSPRCAAEGRDFACRFSVRSGLTQRDGQGIARYEPEHEAVYLYVPRVLTAPPADPATPAVLQRLMELNWRMLTAKFAWNPQDGEVRLSALLHTDSNFDRRALRSLIGALDTVMASHGADLQALQRQLRSQGAVDDRSVGSPRPEAAAAGDRSVREAR